MSKKEKRTFCVKCNEDTFRDKDENSFICTGCGDKTPRTRLDHKIVSIDTVSEDLLIDQEVTLSEEAEKRYNAVVGRMHKLSGMEKQVIELLAEGKSQNDVAEIMSITRGEVTTYLNRARTKLK